MSRKATTLRALTDYFLEKGEILSYHDYVRQDDTPMPPRTIKRLLGAWGRLPRMIKVNYPNDFDTIMGIEPKAEIEEETKVDSEIEAEEQAKKGAAEKLLEFKKIADAKVAALKLGDKNEK